MSSISCCRRARGADCVASALICILGSARAQTRSSARTHAPPRRGSRGGRHETLAYRAARTAEPVGIGPTIATRNSLRFGRKPVEASAGYASRRGCRGRRQLHGAHLRLFTRRLQPRSGLRQYSLADSRIRPQRRVPARDRQEPLRLVVCAHRARRQGRQHLGDRQGLGHGDQVQPGRPRRDGVRTQVGGLRSRRPSARAQGNIYVEDRNNRRIQVFDGDGTFKREIKIDVPFDENAKPAIGNKPDLTTYLQTGGSFTPGAPWALCITPGPNQVLYSSDSYPGRVYKLSLDGKVLGYLGKSGKQPKQFGWIHEIACPSENELYVAEILTWRVQKLILRPDQQKAAVK